MEISLSDYIAAGSLFVAFVALVKSFLSDRRVKKLDVLLKEKELQHHEADEEDMKKADIEVEVIETAPKKMDKLRFYVNVLFPASGNQYKCLPLWQKTKVTKLCQ